jgi:hypothetical protein
MAKTEGPSRAIADELEFGSRRRSGARIAVRSRNGHERFRLAQSLGEHVDVLDVIVPVLNVVARQLREASSVDFRFTHDVLLARVVRERPRVRTLPAGRHVGSRSITSGPDSDAHQHARRATPRAVRGLCWLEAAKTSG